MPYTDAAKNLMLAALAGTNPTTPITHVSLHSGDPGSNGANELTGGSPAYARQEIAFNAPSGGSMDDSTNGAEFDVPASTTVAYVGFWSAATSGTFLASKQLASSEVFAGQGTYTLTDADLDLNA